MLIQSARNALLEWVLRIILHHAYVCTHSLSEHGEEFFSAEYMPHMSLLYGHLLEEELEEAKAKVEAEHGKQLISMQFQVSSLGLYCTDPADVLCKSWKMVCQLPLRAPKR